MKEKDKIVENQELLSLYIKPDSFPEDREGSRLDMQKREKIFIDRNDQFSEDFWGLVQKFPFKKLMDRLEQAIIISALSKFEGNQRKTAEFLGIKPTTLYEKIKKHNISIRKIACEG
jgi:DNA-binding NtrC family response regulator